MRLSIVTTLYYSAPYLQEFCQRSSRAAEQITPDYEIILVNDGSPDNALEIARGLYEQNERIVVVDLSRNFGHHKAIMTGLAYATGDLVMLVDCDLEEPPELLLDFYDKFCKSDADVVYGVAEQREGSGFRRVSGWAYYSLYNAMSQYAVPHDALIARLMTRRYVEQLVEHKEQVFSIDGLMEITGFKQIPVSVEKHYKGTTTYSFRKRLGLAISGITSLSNKPLIYISYLGLAMVIPSGLVIIYLILQYLFGETRQVDGYTSLLVSLWFLGGLIVFIMGIIAVYLSVMFVEIKGRPYTVVRDIYRHHPPNGSSSAHQSYAAVNQLRQPVNRQ